MIDVNKYVDAEQDDLTPEQIQTLKDKFEPGSSKVNLDEVLPTINANIDESIKKVCDLVHDLRKDLVILENPNDNKVMGMIKDTKLEKPLELGIVIKGSILNDNFIVESIHIDKVLGYPDWVITQIKVNDVIFRIE